VSVSRPPVRARTTAFASSDLLDGFGEGQLARAERSFAQKSAADSFGLRLDGQPAQLIALNLPSAMTVEIS
jgi:hypothetical protein